MKNAGMAGAVALVGIGLITIGLSNFANRAEAVPSAVSRQGDTTPRIVGLETAFTKASSQTNELRFDGFLRIWSNGVVEVSGHDLPSVPANEGCGETTCNILTSCNRTEEWSVLQASLNGLTCTVDINGDGLIDGEDLGAIIANWGPTSAALLANPEIGTGEAVALSVVPHLYGGGTYDSRIYAVYRQWDDGTVDFCFAGAGDPGLSCVGAFPFWNWSCCNWSEHLGPFADFHALPFTLPIARQLGDFDRSGLVDGGDLGTLIGTWPVCPD